ncbi:hypothetical protein PAXRUDRAFT_830359 [Paxillus rubicundulus Ve08.2h10]|uniref:Uncharacterized protein n=1 Tax=Paxillus rubicundulus Ve08.2h10 TaxID=930991 RepID=A0A0D0D5N8_9AGAM|nr:hypothetical protein PAXRUDRAFT_830359 [Paxillus rubicundulus Ve08.2h10]
MEDADEPVKETGGLTSRTAASIVSEKTGERTRERRQAEKRTGRRKMTRTFATDMPE